MPMASGDLCFTSFLCSLCVDATGSRELVPREDSMRPLTLLEERLIIALDPQDLERKTVDQAWGELLEVAHALRGTGVCLKIETILRAHGFGAIRILQELGFEVFADTKLSGLPHTMKDDGTLLRLYKPAWVTVMCSAGVASMSALKKQLPDTRVLGVTALTHLKPEDIRRFYPGVRSVMHAVSIATAQAIEAGLDGVVCAPDEARMLRQSFQGLSIVAANIRPSWANVRDDDQNKDRSMTPGNALREGVYALVVGRPVVQDNDPKGAVVRIVDEMAEVA